jgi:hypothetical protein
MNDSLFVCRLQRFGDLPRDQECFVERGITPTVATTAYHGTYLVEPDLCEFEPTDQLVAAASSAASSTVMVRLIVTGPTQRSPPFRRF